MKVQQKIIALDILRNAGAIATERGRKAAILELLGHDMLASRLIQTGDRIDFEAGEVARLSADEPFLLDVPAGYAPPADLAKAQWMLTEKYADMRTIDAEIQSVAVALEAEIDAGDRAGIARWQEGNVPT